MTPILGKDLAAALKDGMMFGGWVRAWRLDSRTRLPPTAAGMSDECWKRDGLTLYIEVKGENDRQSDKQKKWEGIIIEHGCEHERYVLLTSFDQIDELVNFGR